MGKFTDTIVINLRSGDGGAGALSFRREKYIPRGGPDGGDGGRGGDVIIEADARYYNLSHLYPDRVYKAGNGKTGSGRNRSGADGKSLIIKVAPGTQVIDPETDEVIADLIEDESSVKAAEGGIGGKGNAFFKSATHQTPRFSQPGMPGEEKRIRLDLKLIADVGLVGLPNSGKSTLLSKLTNARPKIADYPFTTLIPNLGVLETPSGRICKIADIPGIIEGAHKGHGLGLSFLQHIERVRIILFLIDISEDDPEYNLSLLKSELKSYNRELLNRPSCVLLTKSDTVDKPEIDEKIRLMSEHGAVPVSSISGYNLESVAAVIDRFLERKENEKKSS